MDEKNNLLLKISEGDVYSFFSSGELTEFVLGSRGCQLIVKNSAVEPYHIKFIQGEGGWFVQDISEGKTVKLGRRLLGLKLTRIKEEDVLSIYTGGQKKEKPAVQIEVIRKISQKKKQNVASFSLTGKNEYIIGREPSCDFVVDNPRVEKKHCRIIYDGAVCYVEDMHSMSGTFVNNRKIKRAKLNNYDRISVAGAAYVFYDYALLTSKGESGIEIEAIDVEKTVYDKKTKQKVQLLDRVNMKILAGEFVAVVGGSGAGKSTLVDCINGLRPCTAGKILYDGNEYYENINSYRGVVGIVPQKDIMHDDLTVEQGLYYTAKMRMRAQLDKEEIKKLVRRAIGDVKLTGKETLKISSLSGGQKKRVSIAMELLAEPKVIFLDEPTSGLSPDLDLEMMELLKELASKGRTIVIITHAMDNIDKCDRVAFLGKGGRLCYYGKPENTLEYFRQPSYSKVFAMLSSDKKSELYGERYRSSLANKEGDTSKTGERNGERTAEREGL